jgi:hypothetical protein
MITFKSLGNYGRFGNQMFQYATLFAIAKKKKYDFGVPYTNRNKNEYMDFCLPDCFPNLTAKDSYEASTKFVAQQFNFEYNAGIFGILDDTDIRGYFQSEKYFLDYRNQLLKEFEFSSEIYNKAIDIRSLSKHKTISIHIRLGDYVIQQQNHPVCSIDYYSEALSHLPDDSLIFVFSDENEKAEKIFAKLNKKVVFPESNNKYVDMCTMTLCDYHIIANSSFSWWGSWLSNADKVIAPSKWFGEADHMPKNWSDVYCKNWLVI